MLMIIICIAFIQLLLQIMNNYSYDLLDSIMLAGFGVAKIILSFKVLLCLKYLRN
jgi:hypothetical protein